MGRAERVTPGGRLPSNLSSFVGREAALSDIARLLERERLVTLIGPGGVGKTRVAVRAADALATTCADGAVWVPLADLRDPALVGVSVASACTEREIGHVDVLPRLEPVLRGKQLLLVLDNFEHLLAAAPFVAEILSACPAIRILVTSRAPLRVTGEHLYTIAPLPLPDVRTPSNRLSDTPAIQLFVERARATCGSFELDDESASSAEAICRRLDGLPLAIELAALRLRSLPPRAIRARLERSLDLLVAGPCDGPARHQTLRATMSWSYNLLDEPTQGAFRSLAAFAGEFGLQAATAVTGASSEIQTLSWIDAFVQYGLVYATATRGAEPRYSLLQTIREYAAERLCEAGEDRAVRDRHARIFIEFVERAEAETSGARMAEWLEHVERELDNIRGALSWFIECGDADPGLRLVSAPRNFWIFRGHAAEGDHWIRRLLDVPGPASPSRARGLALRLRWPSVWETRSLAHVGPRSHQHGRANWGPGACAYDPGASTRISSGTPSMRVAWWCALIGPRCGAAYCGTSRSSAEVGPM